MKLLNYNKAIILLFILFMVGGCSSSKKVNQPLLKPVSLVEISRQHSAFHHYVNALLRIKTQEFDKAERELRSALRLNQNSLEINYELASILAQNQNLEEAFELRNNIAEPDVKFGVLMGRLSILLNHDSLAIRYFKNAIENDPGDYSARYYFSRFYLGTEQPDSALKHLKKMVELRQQDMESLTEIARIYYSRGDYDSAAVSFKELLDHEPSNKFSGSGLADSYVRSGKLLEALGVYRNLLEHHPTDKYLISKKINLEIELKQFVEAAQTGLKALEIYPEDTEFIMSTARLLAGNENYAVAESLISQQIARDSTNITLKMLLARMYMDDTKYHEADLLLNDIISEDDMLLDAHILLTSNFLYQDKLDSAILVLERIIPKFPESHDIYYQIGRIYLTKELQQEAADSFRKAYEQKPDEVGYGLALAETLDRLNDFKSAERILTDIINNHPDNATALNNLAYMYVNRDENLSRAEKYLRKALELEPENGAFLDSYGWLLFRMDKVEDALEYIHKAEETLGSDPEIFSHLADIYKYIGDFEKSFEYYKKALELSPNDPELSTKLNSLPVSDK
ncbi:MAG: tetratricopeptide repeat protein [candidate division Zixibacteria bacterium]|nr:tetratricopeptide repeat protein [candidate division Zixibacteria bacterium]